MARHFFKRRARHSASKSYRRSSGKSSWKSDMMFFAGAGLYGALRQKLSIALDPISSKLPFGNLSDEVVLFGALWASKKVLKNPTYHKIATAGMIIEAARVGEQLATGGFNLSGSSSTNQSVMITQY
jgi:hypothetical protein